MVRKFPKSKNDPDLHPYWQAIRDKVCSLCVDADSHGNCRLDASTECPLQADLPRIIRIVRDIRIESMDEYVRELRLILCSGCTHETASGNCRLRDDVDCAVNRYFPLVMEAILSVDRTSGRSKSYQR